MTNPNDDPEVPPSVVFGVCVVLALLAGCAAQSAAKYIQAANQNRIVELNLRVFKKHPPNHRGMAWRGTGLRLPFYQILLKMEDRGLSRVGAAGNGGRGGKNRHKLGWQQTRLAMEVSDDQVTAIKEIKSAGKKITHIARVTGLSRPTIYRVLRTA
jgi:hypothetical protein